MRRHGNICGQRWGVKKFGTDAIDRSMASQCIRIAQLLRTCAQLQPMPAIVICAGGMAYAGRTGAPIINGRIGCVIELLFSGRTKAAQNPVAILKPSNHSPKKRLLPLAFEGYGQSRLVAVTPLPDRCGRRSRPLDVRQDRHQPAPARSNGGGDARTRRAATAACMLNWCSRNLNAGSATWLRQVLRSGNRHQKYLKTPVSIGLLEERKVGRERLLVDPAPRMLSMRS